MKTTFAMFMKGGDVRKQHMFNSKSRNGKFNKHSMANRWKLHGKHKWENQWNSNGEFNGSIHGKHT